MNMKNKIFIISLIILVLLSVSAVSASGGELLANDTGENLKLSDGEIQSDANEDLLASSNQNEELIASGNQDGLLSNTNQEALSSNEWSFNDLQARLNYAFEHDETVVNLHNDYVCQDGEEYINITKNIVINGNGYTIDANGKTGIFYIDDKITEDWADTFTFKNIIFKNGNEGDGSAIYIGSDAAVTCIIENCQFIQNQAKEDGGAIYFNTEDGQLEIKNSIFKNNKALYSSTHKSNGGAINIHDAALIVENTQFIGNDARGHGGAIYSNDVVTITKSTFDGNTALNKGGSLYASDSDVLVADSNFINSKSDDEGGAIYSSEDLAVQNCNFLNNYAEQNGGALYVSGAINWKDSPSTFIGNRIGTGNTAYANKGGAVYAGTFSSNPKGLIFKDSRAWYGGAVYINNKNDVTFESCCFDNNVALKYSEDTGCGAAIYMDSSSSKLSLINNVFTNNKAYDDKAVYNCGSYGTISNNWWGTNTPNFQEPYLVEWHRFGSDDRYNDPNPLKIALVSDYDLGELVNNVTLTLKFIDSNGADFTGKLIDWNVNFTSNKNAAFSPVVIGDNQATVVFTAQEVGENIITANVDNQNVSINFNIKSDFVVLQELINNAVGELNLTRDYKYGAGDERLKWGIVIDKPLIINGNGHTIDGSRQARILYVESNNTLLNNINFVNGYSQGDGDAGVDDGFGGAIYITGPENEYLLSNISISNSNFTNCYSVGMYGGAIYIDYTNNTQILNCSFTNNGAKKSGGAVYSDTTHNTKIINSTFTNNRVSDGEGGAVSVNERTDLYFGKAQIIGCIFNANSARGDVGGAIALLSKNATIESCVFNENEAKDGGAIFVGIDSDNLFINNSNFTNNKATSYGGAIQWLYSQGGRVENSIFLSNRAGPEGFPSNYTRENNNLIFYFTVKENYVNAINSINDLSFKNITYWNGEIVNSDDPINSKMARRINITVNIHLDPNGELVKSTVVELDSDGKGVYDLSDLEDGNYTINVYHYPDTYYSQAQKIYYGLLMDRYVSENDVKLNILDEEEFDYGNCNISFTITNPVNTRVLITDYNSSVIFIDEHTDLDHIIVNLPASDEYYKITVFNGANETHAPCSDSKLFKIVKINSTVAIDPIEDVVYGEDVTVSFNGSTDKYNVTVYDENESEIFSQIINEKSVAIPGLNAGTYSVTVINLGEGNTNQSSDSSTFTVNRKENRFNVTVNDVIYGDEILVTVNADVDGEYIVEIDSHNLTINVADGQGTYSISSLSVGNYSAHVAFDNPNYINIGQNTTFEVNKAKANIQVESFDGELLFNKDNVIVFAGPELAGFSVKIVNSANETVQDYKNYTSTYELPPLDVGEYTLVIENLENPNYVGGNQLSIDFNVTNNNYVDVIVEDLDYGRDLSILVFATVDGNYTINIDGEEEIIEVIDGIAYYEYPFDEGYFALDAGNYTPTVTFDDSDSKYNTILNVTNFTVYRGESNLYIYDIENISYGQDAVIRFADDYPADYHVIVWNESGDVEYDFTVNFDGSKEMRIILSDLPLGNYTISLENMGDDNFDGSADSNTFSVIPGKTIVSDMTRGYNSGLDFKASYVGQNNKPIANVKLIFTINGKNYTATTNAQGVASINPKLAVGTYKVTVTNPITGEKIVKTLKIVKRITGNKNVNTYYAKNYQYKLRIFGNDGKAVKAGFKMKITVNGKARVLKTNKNGYIVLTFNKNYLPRTYKVNAALKGFKVSNKIVVRKVLALKAVKVKRTAKKLVLTAALKEGKKAIKGKKLIFTFKGKKYVGKTNSKGVARVTIKQNVLKKLKAGKKVAYAVTYLRSTVKRTTKVIR